MQTRFCLSVADLSVTDQSFTLFAVLIRWEKVYYHGYKGLKEHSRALSEHIVFTKQGYGKNLCRGHHSSCLWDVNRRGLKITSVASSNGGDSFCIITYRQMNKNFWIRFMYFCIIYLDKNEWWSFSRVVYPKILFIVKLCAIFREGVSKRDECNLSIHKLCSKL